MSGNTRPVGSYIQFRARLQDGYGCKAVRGHTMTLPGDATREQVLQAFEEFLDVAYPDPNQLTLTRAELNRYLSKARRQGDAK